MTFDPDVAALWPGALIQGKDYQLGVGSIKELPIRKRAPLAISINLLTAKSSETVQEPTASNVHSAVANLIAPIEGGADFGSDISFDMTETYSLDQALVTIWDVCKVCRSRF